MDTQNYLKVFRELNDLTQGSLGEWVGRDACYIDAIESGRKRPTAEVMERIAQTFKVPIHAVFPANVDASAERRGGARVYLKRPEPQPPITRSSAAVLREITAVLVAGGHALTPPMPPYCMGRAPRVLTDAAIKKHPPTRVIAAGLPRNLRLVVAIWGDGASILAAVPREAPPPPERWLAKAYNAARRLPSPQPSSSPGVYGFAPTTELHHG